MTNKVVVIISTSDAEKARTGVMYALNALKYGWMEAVRLIFFGPAQKLLLTDNALQDMIRAYREIAGIVACKFIAEQDGNGAALKEIGVSVEYVGELISDHIHAGYAPMVW